MALENTMPPGEPRHVRIPRQLEAKAYFWPQFARGVEAGESAQDVAGDLFFVRFGRQSGDPIWPVDVFSPQVSQAAEIFGYLLADALDGFPVPFYPRCLQKAHEYAQVVDFDLTILQDEIFRAVRGLLPHHQAGVLDAFQMREGDVAARRYES
jgi:hypothetical protein